MRDKITSEKISYEREELRERYQTLDTLLRAEL